MNASSSLAMGPAGDQCGSGKDTERNLDEQVKFSVKREAKELP